MKLRILIEQIKMDFSS